MIAISTQQYFFNLIAITSIKSKNNITLIKYRNFKPHLHQLFMYNYINKHRHTAKNMSKTKLVFQPIYTLWLLKAHNFTKKLPKNYQKNT